ncbi:hypothetical protein RRG08_052916 [Elysia crispata]|uniref:Uncharacterized protein n=1 Tax=Elysia crispata TaxID=231223 RepID=A0AAE1E1L0_9GAST|nr:hypothetical protein RRG08_052916 [Elysia crispata]
MCEQIDAVILSRTMRAVLFLASCPSKHITSGPNIACIGKTKKLLANHRFNWKSRLVKTDEEGEQENKRSNYCDNMAWYVMLLLQFIHFIEVSGEVIFLILVHLVPGDETTR